MPNPEPTSDQGHVPSRACIRLEDVSETRTASIDAEWEALSVAPIQESTLPTVSARPRFETLPGLGPESQHALTPKPQRSRRSPLLVSALAAALSLSLALLGILVWRNHPGIFAPPALVPSVQSNLAAATTEPSTSKVSASAQSLPSALVSAATAPAPASKVEPPAAQPAHPGKPVPRPIRPRARVAADDPAPKWVAANNYRTRQTLASTDNPY